MLMSTPKKAVSSEASLIQCLICAESLENNQRIAVFGRSQWDLRERHFPRIYEESCIRHAKDHSMFEKRNVFHG